MSDANPEIIEGEFWTTLKGNCLDISVLEWCKLFGERSGNHSWQKISEDEERFRSDLRSKLGISDADWNGCWTELRSYRDAFVAHLDDALTMHIPNMSIPMDMVAFYYENILNLDEGSFFVGFPTNLHE